jgi:hypothetical protein
VKSSDKVNEPTFPRRFVVGWRVGATNSVGVAVGGNQTVVAVGNGVEVSTGISVGEYSDNKLEHPKRVEISDIRAMESGKNIRLSGLIATLLYRQSLPKSLLKDVIIFPHE